MQQVVAKRVGGEPPCPRPAESVVDADAAFDDDFADAPTEAPGDNFDGQGFKDLAQVCGRVEVEFGSQRSTALKGNHR